MCALFLEELHEAWQSVLPVQFEVLQVGSHPRLLRVIARRDETVALLSFSLTIGARQGMMRLCLPSRAIRQIADKLAGRGRTPSATTENEDTPTESANDGNSATELAVTLATTSIAASELGSLRVGDIIVTETAADSPAVVSIDGEPQFCGKPGASQGRKAVALSLPGSDAALPEGT